LKLQKLAPKIYALEFDSSENAARTFVRLQENYESPKFRNKIFTLAEFETWYKKFTNNETFTYYKDWSGFNVPGHIVKRFYSGKFYPLSFEEQSILFKLDRHQVTGRFYLLGYAYGDARVKKHEIAHGLYYTNRRYRREVDIQLSRFDMKAHPVANYLRSFGYHNAVVADEFHAWTLTEKEHVRIKDLWDGELEKLRIAIESIYERYAGVA
jgi:hypothetical protein